MPDPVWSKADTHCVWCGKPESHRHGVHCSAVASRGGGAFGRMAVACELRATIEAQEAVIRRFRDGWLPVIDWPDCNAGWERGRTTQPMTEAEQIAYWGEVVRADG